MTWPPTYPVEGLVTRATVARWLIRLGHDDAVIAAHVAIDVDDLHTLRVDEQRRQDAMDDLSDLLGLHPADEYSAHPRNAA